MNPRLLDLFCCEGGAGIGYQRAGFDITGVDITPQPNNKNPVIVTDAIEYLKEHGQEYDVIHASPPCQSYSKALKHLATPQPMLIDLLLELLPLTGRHWIIENVEGAPLARKSKGNQHGCVLCGTMFGLRVYRHRIFQTSFPSYSPAPCAHTRLAMNPHNTKGRARIYAEFGYKNSERIWAKEMGVSWMSKHGAREAIPPVYTEHIGKLAMQYI